MLVSPYDIEEARGYGKICHRDQGKLSLCML